VKAFQLLLPSVFFCSKRQNACVTLHFGSYFRLGLFFPLLKSSELNSPMEVMLFSWKGGAIFFGRRDESIMRILRGSTRQYHISSQEIVPGLLKAKKVKGQLMADNFSIRPSWGLFLKWAGLPLDSYDRSDFGRYLLMGYLFSGVPNSECLTDLEIFNGLGMMKFPSWVI